MTGLPHYLRKLRDRLRTALNALDTVERLEIAAGWGAPTSDAKREAALRTVEKCVLDAADAIGVKPAEAVFYRDIIARLQDENARLTAANVARVTREAA